MNKPLVIISVKIKGEVYSRSYSIKDIQAVVDLFNDIHKDDMKISIIEVREERP